MVTVCAWCKKTLGIKPPYEVTLITHTICDACAVVENTALSEHLRTKGQVEVK